MSDLSKKLSTEPYRGVRDFYPEDMAVEQYIFQKMRAVCEQFGYEEYTASLLEPTDLYRAKSGEEIVNDQTYSFTDRGGRDVTLRPEMTPTIARMVAARRRELIFPLRWYSIPNVFRYENPQRGRLREHWQLNVDLFGASGIEADVEVISMAHKLMQAFGAREKDFVIKINYAGLLHDHLMKELDIDALKAKQVMKILDKYKKIPGKELDEKIENILDKERGKKLAKFLEQNTVGKATEDERFLYLKKIGVLKNMNIGVVPSPFLTRGFDYYTGMVFEVFDTDPKNPRSLFGGGRYDNLLEIFGDEKVPAIGFGAGDVTIRDFLETHGLLPNFSSKIEVTVCVIDESIATMASAEKIADDLRANGLNVAVDISHKKIGDQIKNADKRKIPCIIAIGEREVASKKLILKTLATGEEKEFSSASELAGYVKSIVKS